MRFEYIPTRGYNLLLIQILLKIIKYILNGQVSGNLNIYVYV